jgi:hypothetical protein
MNNTIKNALIILGLLVGILSLPATVQAEETCVQNYGQPVVCGVSAPEPVVKAGLADFSLRVVGSLSMASSSVLLLLARRERRSSLS